MMFDCSPERFWNPDEKRESQFVFIGKDLDEEKSVRSSNLVWQIDCVCRSTSTRFVKATARSAAVNSPCAGRSVRRI